MLPVYTHALTPAEYGLLETLLRLVGVCMSVGFIGIRQGYMRLYFDDERDDERRNLASTSLLATFLVAFGVLFPVAVAGVVIARHFGVSVPAFSSILLAVWLAFEATFLFGLASLQVRLRSTAFVVTQTSRMVLLLGTNYVLLHVAGLGIGGAVAGNVIAAVISGGIAGAVVLRSCGWRYSPRIARELLSFGLPYVPLAALTYICANADRFALIYFDAITYLGLLALAAKLGEMALSIAVGFIEGIWGPFAYDASRQPDGATRIGRLYTLFVALCVYLALGVSLAAPLAIEVLASPDFREAASLVAIVAFGWIFMIASNLSEIGILIRKRTSWKPLIMSVTAVFALGAQLVLTPKFGVFGAVAATALTNVFMFSVVRIVSRRLYRMETKALHFLYIAAGGYASFAVGTNILSSQPDVVRTFAAISCASLMFAAAMHVSGVVRIGDLAKVLKELMSRPGPQ